MKRSRIKRGKALRRGKPMKRGTARLMRGDQLSRGAKLRTKTRLRHVGKRGRKIRATLAKLRPLVFERDGHLCKRCRHPLCLPLQAHHRQSRGTGGEHSLDNLETLGEPCHRKVTARSCDDWADWVDTRKGAPTRG